jgi:hypothetical protein
VVRSHLERLDRNKIKKNKKNKMRTTLPPKSHQEHPRSAALVLGKGRYGRWAAAAVRRLGFVVLTFDCGYGGDGDLLDAQEAIEAVQEALKRENLCLELLINTPRESTAESPPLQDLSAMLVTPITIARRFKGTLNCVCLCIQPEMSLFRKSIAAAIRSARLSLEEEFAEVQVKVNILETHELVKEREWVHSLRRRMKFECIGSI